MKKIILCLVSAIFFITACGTSDRVSDSPARPGDDTNVADSENRQINENAVSSEIISTEFEFMDGNFTFSLKNVSDKGVTLTFSNLQEYEYVIKDQAGNHLYTYSMDKMFGEAFVEITLSPTEEHSITVDINSILSTLNPDSYTIEIWSVANEADGLSSIMEIEIEASTENSIGSYVGEIDRSSVEIIDKSDTPNAYRLTNNVVDMIALIEPNTSVTFSFYEMNGQRFLTMIASQ